MKPVLESTVLDIGALIQQEEGQFFDRKSLFVGPPGNRVPRNKRAVRDQVAEYVAAFANAEGGVLVLGVEDDGDVIGHAYPPDAVDDILLVPERRIDPLQPRGQRMVLPHPDPPAWPCEALRDATRLPG